MYNHLYNSGKKGECVKKGYPNFVMINHAINQMKNDAIAVRNGYEALGEAYTADMVLRPRKVRHSYVMSQIQQPNVNLLKIATETGKSVKTIHQYVSLLNDDDLI